MRKEGLEPILDYATPAVCVTNLGSSHQCTSSSAAPSKYQSTLFFVCFFVVFYKASFKVHIFVKQNNF